MSGKLCKECIKYKKFGKNCWYFWDLKKVCTRFEKEEGEETYKSVDEINSLVEEIKTTRKQSGLE
jgi:hypothetical protein